MKNERGGEIIYALIKRKKPKEQMNVLWVENKTIILSSTQR